MVPLTALVKTTYVTGPDLMPHFNGLPAAKIIGSQAPGFSSGQAIAAMEEVGQKILPAGYQFAWSGLSYDEKRAGGTSTVAFMFGLIFVFLVLAAQYESWTLPGAVMTAVPFGVLGALVFNWMRGLDNDVYFQIGLLVLIDSVRRTRCCACRRRSNCGRKASRSSTRRCWPANDGCVRSS